MAAHAPMVKLLNRFTGDLLCRRRSCRQLVCAVAETALDVLDEVSGDRLSLPGVPALGAAIAKADAESDPR
jgi:hypothetical protein